MVHDYHQELLQQIKESIFIEFNKELEKRVIYALYYLLNEPIRCKISKKVIEQRKIEIQCIHLPDGFGYVLRATPFKYLTRTSVQTVIDLNFQGNVLQEYRRWKEANEVFLRKKMYIDLQEAQQLLPY